MSTQNNEVLGYVKCTAGGRASVHRTKRGKARLLYTRCDCCGCDQRTGAGFQTDIYNRTEWLGTVPEAPPNYLGAEKQPEIPVVQPKIEPEPQPKVEPEPTEWKPAPPPVVEPKASGDGLGFVAMLGVGLSCLGFILSKARG